MRLLVVEDELKMAGLLVRGLREDGHAVDVARTGDDALWMGQAVEYDAVVLDLMLPGLDGVSVCRAWRENGVWTPVLMLTARDGVEDRVAGLDAGADDYLAKPFSFAELNARLRALARRGVSERPAVVEVGDLRLDPATRQVWRGAVEIQLSTKEFALLDTLMRRAGLVRSRLQLLEHAWDYAYENRSNVVDVYIRYLREKVDRPFGRESIETVRGAGYRLRKDGEDVSRLPIRVRLTLVFAVVMTVVLTALGAFLYLRLGSTLDERVNERLQARSDALASAAAGGATRVEDLRFVGDEDGLAQVIDSDGSITAAFGYPARSQLLTDDELRRARDARIVIERMSRAVTGTSRRLGSSRNPSPVKAVA